MWALDFAAKLHSLHFLTFNNTKTYHCFVLSTLLVVCWGRKLMIFHTLEIARLPRNHKCGRLSVCGFSAECSTTTYSKPTYERTHWPQNLWWKTCQFASWTKILASVALTFSTSLASLALDKTHIVHTIGNFLPSWIHREEIGCDCCKNAADTLQGGPHKKLSSLSLPPPTLFSPF